MCTCVYCMNVCMFVCRNYQAHPELNTVKAVVKHEHNPNNRIRTNTSDENISMELFYCFAFILLCQFINKKL